MNRSAPARWTLIILLVTLFLATTACALTNLVQPARRESAAVTTPTPQPEPSATAAQESAPGKPTSRATEAPRAEIPEGVTTGVPSEAGQEFVLEMTEAELNRALLGDRLGGRDFQVEDAQVRISPLSTTITFRAINEQPRLALDITVRGMLVAHEGQAYYRVDEFELGPSVSGLVRGIATAMIEQALDELSTEQGIPVRVSGYDVLAVEQLQGKVRIRGRTR